MLFAMQIKMKNKGTEMVISHSFIVQMSMAIIVGQYCKPLMYVINIVILFARRSKYIHLFE